MCDVVLSTMVSWVQLMYAGWGCQHLVKWTHVILILDSRRSGSKENCSVSVSAGSSSMVKNNPEPVRLESLCIFSFWLIVRSYAYKTTIEILLRLLVSSLGRHQLVSCRAATSCWDAAVVMVHGQPVVVSIISMERGRIGNSIWREEFGNKK